MQDFSSVSLTLWSTTLDRGGSWSSRVPRGLYHRIFDAPVVETLPERRLKSFDGKRKIAYWPEGW